MNSAFPNGIKCYSASSLAEVTTSLTLLRPQGANMVFSTRDPGGRMTTRHVSVFTQKEFFSLREVHQYKDFGEHRKVWKGVQPVSLCSVPPGAGGGRERRLSAPGSSLHPILVGPGASTLGRYPGLWYIPPRGPLAVHTLGTVSLFLAQSRLPAGLRASCIQIFVSRFALEESNLTQQLKTKQNTKPGDNELSRSDRWGVVFLSS